MHLGHVFVPGKEVVAPVVVGDEVLVDVEVVVGEVVVVEVVVGEVVVVEVVVGEVVVDVDVVVVSVNAWASVADMQSELITTFRAANTLGCPHRQGHITSHFHHGAAAIASIIGSVNSDWLDQSQSPPSQTKTRN